MTHTRKNKNTHNKTKKRIFKKTDFSSGDGFLTSIWGPPMWHYLHTMSFNYPVNPTTEDKKHYRDFVINLQYVLPCKHCRMNLKTNFKQLPLKMSDMKNRESFSRFVYELHELVNKMLHKKSNLSYCDVRERYEHFRSRCTEEKPNLFKFKNNSFFLLSNAFDISNGFIINMLINIYYVIIIHNGFLQPIKKTRTTCFINNTEII